MFYRHVILDVNGEKVLYLYLNNTYEFAADFNSTQKEQSLKGRVQNYLYNRGITFDGHRIYLVVDGIIVGTLFYQPEKKEVLAKYQDVIKAEENQLSSFILKEEDTKDLPKTAEYTVLLEYDDHTSISIKMEDYLLGVLATVIPPIFHMEALKAQAVLCRTYALKQMLSEHRVRAHNPYQNYRDLHYYKLAWSTSYTDYVGRLKKAIEETKGQYLAYEDKLVDPFFHRLSNGQTELPTDNDKPYLANLPSVWDLEAKEYFKTTVYDLSEVAKRLNIPKEQFRNIKILETSKGNRLQKLQIGEYVFDGDTLMQLLGLRSNDISLLIHKNDLHVTTRGIGHGIGMSQFGANKMAEGGYHYPQILAYYYPNTRVWTLVLRS